MRSAQRRGRCRLPRAWRGKLVHRRQFSVSDRRLGHADDHHCGARASAGGAHQGPVPRNTKEVGSTPEFRDRGVVRAALVGCAERNETSGGRRTACCRRVALCWSGRGGNLRQSLPRRGGGGMADQGYDTDLALWAESQARALRDAGHAGTNLPIDWENVAEEIEALGKSQARELASRIRTILVHLMKLQASPATEPTRAVGARRSSSNAARSSGSWRTRPVLRQTLANVIAKEIGPARHQAALRWRTTAKHQATRSRLAVSAIPKRRCWGTGSRARGSVRPADFGRARYRVGRGGVTV